jgi:hypothetical protein
MDDGVVTCFKLSSQQLLIARDENQDESRTQEYEV